MILSYWWYTFFYMWCYLVHEIVIIAVNLDQSPLLLDIHYALLTHKLLFGYNNFGSGLFGIALFSWHLYSHSVHCNNKNCSNNIHSHSFVCTNTILLLFVHHTIIGLHLHWFYFIIQWCPPVWLPSTGTIPRSNNNDAMRLQSMRNGARPD